MANWYRVTITRGRKIIRLPFLTSYRFCSCRRVTKKFDLQFKYSGLTQNKRTPFFFAFPPSRISSRRLFRDPIPGRIIFSMVATTCLTLIISNESLKRSIQEFRALAYATGLVCWSGAAPLSKGVLGARHTMIPRIKVSSLIWLYAYEHVRAWSFDPQRGRKCKYIGATLTEHVWSLSSGQRGLIINALRRNLSRLIVYFVCFRIRERSRIISARLRASWSISKTYQVSYDLDDVKPPQNSTRGVLIRSSKFDRLSNRDLYDGTGSEKSFSFFLLLFLSVRTRTTIRETSNVRRAVQLRRPC